MTKQELRKQMRQLKALHKGESGEPFLDSLHAFNTMMLYHALPDEVPTQQLIDRLVAEGKTVVLPRVVSDTDMELRRYTGPQDLQRGAFGIMEPTGELFTDYEQLQVAVIPGMAFDREGHRLGRGKGYYDRLLSHVPYIYKIGLCYDWQLVDHVPTNEHDIKMDEVVVSKSGCR